MLDRQDTEERSSAAAAASLRAALSEVVASDHPAAGRLKYARTAVTFVVEGGEQVTLRLDGDRPRLAEGGDGNGVEIELTSGQAAMLVAGDLHVPNELAHGTLRARGPVRRYLEIDPILRGLMRRTSVRPVSVPHDGHAVAAESRLGPDEYAIETRDLHKRFGSNRILRGANLSVPEGVISIVLGPSGTGKSVLLSHIIGLMKADKGDVMVRGRSLGAMSRAEILALRLEVGVMFQDGALFSTMNVYDNVAFPLRQHTDMGEDEIRDVVMRHLDGVGLADAVHRRPAQLSGGMKKRAGLARAMVLDPGIVICDEPDSGLDPVRTALLGELLAEEHEQMGGTMLVITHNIALARRIGEHVSVLWQGKVVESGPADDVFASGDPFIHQFLTSATEGPLSMDAA